MTMATSSDTQRLISVSLGKIAQSRGQRGGINLHKNLLVATVLHKARTAYMMQSYTYQQNLHRQKCQQQQMQISAPISAPAPVCSTSNTSLYREEVSQPPRDSNLDQPTATLTGSGECRSENTAGPEVTVYEPMTIQASERLQDKENARPVSGGRLTPDKDYSKAEGENRSDDHLAASTQLSHDAQLAASQDNGCQGLTTRAFTTCNVLKRHRENPSACSQDQEAECPVSKKARVSNDSSPSHSDSYLSDLDVSSDDSDSESEIEMMHTYDSPQITNLVNIFNSGFSGLCALSYDSNNNSKDQDNSGYPSDLDISGSTTQFTPLSAAKIRPESPSPAYSRKMSEASLMCSSQVGRMDSLPSAIVLSA
ncbi:unnamed protein product [Lymnaea stagnalis]|uniref:Uncharacterized protein n=1 Tax=Lymnaea stagnalis TaxID=6523 RepID=A0AAV2GYU1_LYMST